MATTDNRRVAVPRKDEAWGEYAKRCRSDAVRVGTLDTFMRVVIKLLKQRDERQAELEQRAAALDARVQELESRPGLAYQGVWEEGKWYRHGDVVTRDGAMWHSNLNSNFAKPGQVPLSWTLCVKAGRDAKDVRR